MHNLVGLTGNARLAEAASALEAKGEPFAVATVVNRTPPVSAQLGDKAIITADGTLIGWIGGSCSQPVVRREAMAALQAGKPRLVKLTTAALEGAAAGDNVTTVAMTCPSGGEAEIYIEPHMQRPRVVAAGDTPMVRALAQLAPIVGFDVTLVSEAPAPGGPADGVRHLALSEFASARLGANAFVVVSSAGHYDEEALMQALRTDAPYVALVASRKRARAVFECLRSLGVTDAALGRIRTPAGLDLGAGTQEEIALGVLAEMVKEYRSRVKAATEELFTLPMAAPVLARDPVCGMDVEVASARHTAEHDGTAFYFCCPHCRARFVKNPVAYLS